MNWERILLGLVLFALVLNLVFVFSSNFGITGFSFYEKNLNAPSDFLDEEDILIEDGRVIILLEDYVISKYDSSGSMIPVFDENANGIGIKPNSEGDVNIGDIVSFYQGEELFVHRVVGKGGDDEGVFFVTKGDRNNFEDGRIRFSQIDSVLVVLVY